MAPHPASPVSTSELNPKISDIITIDDDDDDDGVPSTQKATSAPISAKEFSIMPPLKRRKTQQQCGDAKPKATTSSTACDRGQADPSSRATQQQTLSVVVLEAGDDATISYGIMDRVQSYAHKTNTVTCLQKDMSSPSSSSSSLSLCHYYSTVHHIQQRDQWSCGTRNLQMMLAAIVPQAPSHHPLFRNVPWRSKPTVPSKRTLLQALERAWKDDFDAKGAQHYGSRIVGKTGRSAHIGAIEVANLLWYYSVDATVVQFIKCHESRTLLPKFVKAYFSKAVGLEGCSFCMDNNNNKVGQHPIDTNCPRVSSKYCANGLLDHAAANLEFAVTPPECGCPLLPLYLQWEGHSVTIIGIDQDEQHLLVLDPLQSAGQLERIMDNTRSLQPLRLATNKLSNKDTQIILATLLPLGASEKKFCKRSGNIVTAAEAAVQAHHQGTAA